MIDSLSVSVFASLSHIRGCFFPYIVRREMASYSCTLPSPWGQATPALASRRQLWSTVLPAWAEFPPWAMFQHNTLRNIAPSTSPCTPLHEDDIELVETNHAIATWAWEARA